MLDIATLKNKFQDIAHKQSEEAAIEWLSDHLFTVWEESEQPPSAEYLIKTFSHILIEYSLAINNVCIQKSADYLCLNRTTLICQMARLKMRQYAPANRKYKPTNATKVLPRKCKLCNRSFEGDVSVACPKCGNNNRRLIMIKRDLPKIRY